MSQQREEAESVTPGGDSSVADSAAVTEDDHIPANPRRRMMLIAGGVPLAMLLLLVAAWGIDTAVSGDRVVRNVTAQGVSLGGLDRNDIDAAAADLTAKLGTEPATLIIGTNEFDTDPVTLGGKVDAEALADAAFDARRGGFVLTRPFRWLGTFFSEVEVPVTYIVDEAQIERATEEFIDPLLSLPMDPEVTVVGGELTVEPGADGARVEDGALLAAMPGVMDAGAPYVVELDLEPINPDVATDDLIAVVDEANAATAEPVAFRVLSSDRVVDVDVLRSWVVLDVEGATPSWSIDNQAAIDHLAPLYTGLGADDQQARFDVSDGKPIIIPASESVVCCEDDTGERIKTGLLAPPEEPDDIEGSDEEGADEDDDDADESEDGEEIDELVASRTIELAPKIADSDAGVAELEALGIIEEVSTFTTFHSCCENRVTNIQLMADIVKGYVIEPGERFSLNGVVGRRDTARGFLPAGAIAQGVLEPQVGGGVSQFTTTIFNASFFAGLDFVEYQSHSLYFSRYPRGREATISFPAPDFEIENNTPYGILIWPTYTDTSITVTFYSTKNIEVSCVESDDSLVQGPDACDDAVRWGSQGACTRNTTVRHRLFEDGTENEDSVFAVYRPGEGLDCAGNSTRPTTTVEGDPDGSSTVPGETTAPGDTTPGESTTPTESTTQPTPTEPPPTEPPPTEPPPTEPPADG